MKKFSLTPASFIRTACFTMAVFLLVLIFLPHDDFIRFQELSRESVHYARLKWIYQRIHFDKARIDVAFVGTSHTQSGIDSHRVEQGLKAQGKDLNVVNFAIPHLGRDLQYLITKELIENRKLKLLVIETQHLEARAPHPGFQHLATVKDLLEAPVLINTGVIENFARLPLRQLRLFERSVAPQYFGLEAGFVQDSYEGLHFNDTYQLHGFPEPRTSVNTREFFKKELDGINQDTKEKAKKAAAFDLPYFDHNPLYRYNNLYLEKIVALAKKHSVQVIFLYVPYLDGPSKPLHSVFLESLADTLIPDEIMHNAQLWQNANHLNYYGASELSDWASTEIVKLVTLRAY